MKGFPQKLPHMSFKEGDYFNRKIDLPTIFFRGKYINQTFIFGWCFGGWFPFVQGCHSSSQRGGAKSSGDPSGTNFKTHAPKPQQLRNMAVAFVLAVFFLVEMFFSGKEITSEFIERELYGIEICQHKTILGPDLLSLAKKYKQISQQWMYASSSNQCCLTMSFFKQHHQQVYIISISDSFYASTCVTHWVWKGS